MTRRRVLAGPDARDSLDARTLVRSAWWMSGAHMTAQLAAYASLLIVARLIAPRPGPRSSSSARR
jgi:hypothetical protein